MPEREEEMRGGRADLEAALHRLSERVDVPPKPNYANQVLPQLDPLRDKKRRHPGRLVPTANPLAAGAVVLLVALVAV